MVSGYLLEDLMLIFYRLQLLLSIFLTTLYYLKGINVFSLFSSSHIHLTKCSLTQKLQYLKIYINKKNTFKTHSCSILIFLFALISNDRRRRIVLYNIKFKLHKLLFLFPSFSR